jgi:hypothetical protein
MLELLLIDELERIGKKDLARTIYEDGVTESIKEELYPIFLRILSNKDRKALLMADRGIIRIEKRLRKSSDTTNPAYEALLNDQQRLLSLKNHKIDGNYHLKNAADKYLACAICSCLRHEEEPKEIESIKI